MNTPGIEIVLDDGLAQESVALFRAIAMEGFHLHHFIDRLPHAFGHMRTKRVGHIVYTQVDKAVRRMNHLELFYLPTDVRKHIVLRKFQKIFVHQCHTNLSFLAFTMLQKYRNLRKQEVRPLSFSFPRKSAVLRFARKCPAIGFRPVSFAPESLEYETSGIFIR